MATNVAPTILKDVAQPATRSVTATIYGESAAQEATDANWILVTGSWDDTKEWNDTEVWVD